MSWGWELLESILITGKYSVKSNLSILLTIILIQVGSMYWIEAVLGNMVFFFTRHMANDSQSQSTFAASQSKDMLKYDQPVKKAMM